MTNINLCDSKDVKLIDFSDWISNLYSDNENTDIQDITVYLYINNCDEDNGIKKQYFLLRPDAEFKMKGDTIKLKDRTTVNQNDTQLNYLLYEINIATFNTNTNAKNLKWTDNVYDYLKDNETVYFVIEDGVDVIPDIISESENKVDNETEDEDDGESAFHDVTDKVVSETTSDQGSDFGSESKPEQRRSVSELIPFYNNFYKSRNNDDDDDDEDDGESAFHDVTDEEFVIEATEEIIEQLQKYEKSLKDITTNKPEERIEIIKNIKDLHINKFFKHFYKIFLTRREGVNAQMIAGWFLHKMEGTVALSGADTLLQAYSDVLESMKEYENEEEDNKQQTLNKLIQLFVNKYKVSIMDTHDDINNAAEEIDNEDSDSDNDGVDNLLEDSESGESLMMDDLTNSANRESNSPVYSSDSDDDLGLDDMLPDGDAISIEEGNTGSYPDTNTLQTNMKLYSKDANQFGGGDNSKTKKRISKTMTKTKKQKALRKNNSFRKKRYTKV